ncbi:hypothetical protein D3C86_1634720 [compost metagenome]
MIRAIELGSQRRTTSNGRTTRNNTVGAEHTFAQVGNVLRAALAATGTSGLAEDFRHHAVDITAFCNAVPMATMGGGNIVLVGQVHAHPHCACFLASVQVSVPGDITGTHLNHDPLFENTDGLHGPIGLEQPLIG